jgi:hypothetical protein
MSQVAGSAFILYVQTSETQVLRDKPKACSQTLDWLPKWKNAKAEMSPMARFRVLCHFRKRNVYRTEIEYLLLRSYLGL